MSMKKPQLGMSARKTVGNTVYHIFMVALSVIMVYPFIWSLLSSFKSSEQLYGGNPAGPVAQGRSRWRTTSACSGAAL